MWGVPWFYGLDAGPAFFLGVIGILFIAALMTLKGYALWSAAKRSEIWWFVALLIFNTVGLLEAIYVIFFVKEWHKKRTSHHNHTDQSHHTHQ
jgi:NADH:ubiquinone oxidoreductase subunit 6 (subunit J)